MIKKMLTSQIKIFQKTDEQTIELGKVLVHVHVHVHDFFYIGKVLLIIIYNIQNTYIQNSK